MVGVVRVPSAVIDQLDQSFPLSPGPWSCTTACHLVSDFLPQRLAAGCVGAALKNRAGTSAGAACRELTSSRGQLKHLTRSDTIVGSHIPAARCDPEETRYRPVECRYSGVRRSGGRGSADGVPNPRRVPRRQSVYRRPYDGHVRRNSVRPHARFPHRRSQPKDDYDE
jgi:hypothetical protein